ncbi:hypothetical protein FB382_001303 [Nocardioides ginsengisegetis]|uniref:Uncharacterized protein n=1 Tax=Nocardioides ginsengisegetis TaxID=661491 RepID=A0A7W3IYL3_9ACTN|nr:hypothetical protein [Nocardioides ginsengisegetis]MBA8803012.1 hypothetical protein [Nocardioides ginsengisegetis]
MSPGRTLLVIGAIPIVAVAAFITVGRPGVAVDGPVVARDSGWLGQGGGEDAGLGGTLRYVDGCLLLDASPVVWPEGTTWAADQRSVRLPNDELVAIGDHVFGGGGVGGQGHYDTDHWRSTPMGRATAGCLKDDEGVFVFNAHEDLEVTHKAP